MTSKKTSSAVTIHLGSIWRWLLFLPAMLAILGAWFAVHWYVGNTIAEYAPGVTEGGIEMAQMAVRWAPGDALTHWRLGSLKEKVFSAENMAAAVSEYETAVKLSPNDYRYWMELGRALEASGEREKGELALRRAVELAPAYSHPRWQFGNLLLREGKYDEAFEQLGHAAEVDNEMRWQVFGLAMQIFDGDINEIVRVAGVSPLARMQFALFLVATLRFDDAMRMWNNISPADRQAQRELSKELAQSLLRAKQFRLLMTIMSETEPEGSVPPPEQFWNGGFESDLELASTNTFKWVIESRGGAQIGVDSHAHSGQKSLRILFKAPRALEKIPIAQTVVVEPEVQYRFECYLRTEDMISANMPALLILDAVDGTALGGSPLPTGTHDWQRVTFDFTAKPKHDAITVFFGRAPCGGGEICPIFGTVWYDDFNLQRIGGSGSPRRDAGRPRR